MLYLVGHVEVDALLEEHHGTVGVTVERCDVHQCAAVLGALEDGCLELVRQKLDDGRVSVLRGEVHRGPI